MSRFYLVPLFAACVNALLALFVVSRNWRLRINQVFCAWGLALATWNLGVFALFPARDADEALIWARVTHLGVILIPVLIFHLTLLLTRTRLKFILRLAYAVTALFIVADFTPFYIRGVRHLWFSWYSLAGPVFWIFCSGVFPALVLPTLYLLIRRLRSCPPHEKRKFQILAVTSVMLAALGSHDLLIVMGFDRYPVLHWTIYPWGSLCASLYGVTVGYSVMHDQLLDMHVALGRHAATIIRLGFLIATAYILLALVALVVPSGYSTTAFISSLMVLAASAGITSLFFPKLLGGRTETLERRILGDRFEYQDQVRAFVQGVEKFRDAPVLLNETARLLTSSMRLSRVELLIFDVRTQEVKHRMIQPVASDSAADAISIDASIIEQLRTNAAPFVDCRDAGPWSRNGAQPVADLVFRIGGEERPHGALLAGKKEDGEPITNLDVELLAALSTQVGYALDRIDLAEQAALTEKHEVLGELSRGLAHDLNGLITPVSVYLQLQNGAHEEDADKLALYRMATRAINTVKTYVQEAMFFANTFKLNLMPVSITAVLSGVKEVAEARAKDKGVALSVEPPATDYRFSGDRILLQRMLSNLVFNAVDASEPGRTVRIQGLALTGHRRRPDTVRFIVVDQGCGIPAENLERVFDPYFSTKDTGDKVRGFGLGLTVAQRIVHLHHGSISLKSTVGIGTTLQVDLPPDPGAFGQPAGTKEAVA